MPGLLTLKTDLKSLKYGHDQPNGGSSNEPYIKVDINTVDNTFNRVRLTKFDDGLVRGGTVGALNASVVDALRISKFLVDFPKGPLFISKQVGLQLSNPRLEYPKNPANIAAGGLQNQLAASTKGVLQPTRIYNLGLNTLAQIPTTAFGLHFDRHGFSPIQNEASKYEAVVTANNENNNRLVELSNKFSSGNPLIIDQYPGGPGSVYGIGQTIIHRAENRSTNDKNKISAAFSQSANLAGRTRGNNGEVQDIAFGLDRLLGASNQTGSIFSPSGSTPPLSNNDHNIPVNLNNRNATTDTNIKDDKSGIHHWDGNNPVGSIKITDTFDYGISAKYSSSPLALSGSTFDLSKEIDSNDVLFNSTGSNKNIGSNKDKTNPNQRGSGVDIKNENDLVAKGPSSYPDPDITSSSSVYNKPDYKLDLPDLAYNYGSPAIKSYQTVKNAVLDSTNKGKQNATSQKNLNSNKHILKTGTVLSNFDRTTDTVVNDDTLALIFNPIDPFTGRIFETLKFLAYITDYSDTFDSTWSDVKYAGRAEKFYIFNEFKRSINLGFNIPCFNEDELSTKHQNLNKLVSILAGRYNNNLLGGVITYLTVGNYVDRQPGIITNLNFSPISDGSWDLKDKLAFYIKVSFGFTIIHRKLPQYDIAGSGSNNIFIKVPNKNQQSTQVIPEPTISTTFNSASYNDVIYQQGT